VASRRWNTTDLRKKDEYDEKDGLGLHVNVTTDNAFRRLLLWENLEELAFSNCYLEGELPDFKVGEEGVAAYTQKDVDAWGGDTIQYLADNALPKILPNCTMLRLNLNFLTGDLPDWLLYHPHFMDWAPDLLIFNQQEKGLNSAGEALRFDNEPKTFDYYYDVFPGTQLYDGGKADSTGKFIYAPTGKELFPQSGGKVEVGTTYHVKIDLKKYMKEAFDIAKSKGALEESEWKNMAVNGFNIGWEVSNLAKVGVKIENMSLRVVEYEK
jgi:hypothetical protein